MLIIPIMFDFTPKRGASSPHFMHLSTSLNGGEKRGQPAPTLYRTPQCRVGRSHPYLATFTDTFIPLPRDRININGSESVLPLALQTYSFTPLTALEISPNGRAQATFSDFKLLVGIWCPERHCKSK